MDYIWTPWRYQYMKEVTGGKQPECIFCDALARKNDAETLIVHRGAKAFCDSEPVPLHVGARYDRPLRACGGTALV